MSYYIEKISEQPNSFKYIGEKQKVAACKMEFICDTDEDIKKLPTTYIPDENGRYCAPGSTAMVIAPFGMYVLGVSDNRWIKI